MSSTQLHVMLADDDIDDCVFFKAALTDVMLATQFSVVHDGEELMQLLTGKSNSPPDVLFLDINMPRKNGFECLAEIKASNELKHLPVIIFSTSFEQEVVNLLFKSGAQYFVRKPSEFQQFKKIIQQTLARIVHEDVSQTIMENFVITV